VQGVNEWLEQQDLGRRLHRQGRQHGLALFMGGGGGAAERDTKGQATTLKATFADIE